MGIKISAYRFRGPIVQLTEAPLVCFSALLLICEFTQWQGHPMAKSTINGQHLVRCRYMINGDWDNKTMELQSIEPKRVQNRRKR